MLASARTSNTKLAVGDIMRATAFCLLLVSGWIPSISAACNKGWFGLNCQYKCHCADTVCENDSPCQRCEAGWFGPDCQYKDLACAKSSEPRLTDGYDSTCLNPRTHLHLGEVVVSLSKAYPFTWLRVHVSDPDFLHSLKFRYHEVGVGSCHNASVDNTTLDIHCDLDKPVQYVYVSGEGVKHLCSVYISGGRNVALRQLTNQSTTYNHKNVSFVSSRAVDGDTSQRFAFCSSTKNETATSKATFYLTFSQPKKVNTFIIYHRNNDDYFRKNFQLVGLDENKSPLFNHTSLSSAISVSVYTFIVEDVTLPISLVKIEANNFFNILTLCEVEIYGESACKPGQFGRDCEHTCNCANRTACFVSTGGCPSGCGPGFYGAACDQSGKAEPSTSVLPIVGVVVGVILVVIVVVVIVVVLLRRRKTTQTINNELLRQENAPDVNQSDTESGYAVLDDVLPLQTSVKSISVTPSDTTKGGNDKGKQPGKEETLLVYSNTVCEQNTTALSIDALVDVIKLRDRTFFQNQFNKIQVNLSATMSVALSPENIHKNRYKNISAYDHSRVHLIPNVDKRQEDYINASYIEGYGSGETFIASQGPSKLILVDFVRMLWEQKVDKVIMLTNLVEQGKLKCEQYWPDDGEMALGEITVHLARTLVFADYTIRILQLKKGDHPAQNVTHFHFTTWPDKDVPTGPWGLVEFEQRVASYPTQNPIVVHCSAGVGRTGTFIALRNIMIQAELTGNMDFFKTVQKLRQDRVNMVQTVDQYTFLHKAALVALICMGTTVTSRDIQDQNQTFGTKSEQTKMEAEFKAICQAHDNLLEVTSADDSSDNVDEQTQNIQKNRFNSILPNSLYRAILECENSSLGGYINAVLVPSFTKRDQQILTQLPMPETTVDFWRVIIQYKVTLVVAFETDLKSTDSTVTDYLPAAESEPAILSIFKLRTEPVKSSTFWKQDTVYLTVDRDQINNTCARTTLEKHNLTHLTCTTTNLEPGFLLALIEQIRSLQSRARGRILFTCRNGATYSGLVCVLSLLLDRMDNDQCLTVPLVVGAIKAIRPEVIPTLDQYRLLYHVLHLYSENMGEYSNFGSATS